MAAIDDPSDPVNEEGSDETSGDAGARRPGGPGERGSDGDDDAFAFSFDDAGDAGPGDRQVPPLTVFPPADHDPDEADLDLRSGVDGEHVAADRDRFAAGGFHGGDVDDRAEAGVPIRRADEAGAAGQADDASFAASADEVSFSGLDEAGGPADGELPFDDASAGDDMDAEGSMIAALGPTVFVPAGGFGGAADGGSEVLADDTGTAASTAGESASESAMFSAVVEESTAFEGSGTGSESFSGDSQGIGDGVALAAELAAVTATARPGQGAARAAEAWPRQLAHIVLGGVLAIPVAYSILLWGFQKDPFRIAASLPEGVRSLLPARVRAGRAPSRLPSLDRLPTPAAPALDDAGHVVPTGQPADRQPDLDTSTTAALAPVNDSSAPQPATSESSAADAAPPPMAADPTVAAVEEDTPAAVDPFAAPPVTVPTADLAPAPPVDVVASPAPDVGSLAPVGGAPPAGAGSRPSAGGRLDRSGVDEALARAREMAAALAAVPEDGPERDTRLVDWYRTLSLAAERVVSLEKQAADAGEAWEVPRDEVAEAAIGRVAGARAFEDLRGLGLMWLESRRRDSDGVIVAGVLDGTAEHGAVWASQVVLSATAADGAEPRRVVVVSRRMPAAAAGDTVLVAGVILADGVVWAADVWAVAE